MSSPQDQLISLFLPEGLLEYFDLKEVGSDNGMLCIYLEEKNIIPEEYRKENLHAKGFYPEIRVHDFPIRGKKVLLCIKRRRWEIVSTGQTVHRNWELVRNGTRMTTEFALFLKGIFG